MKSKLMIAASCAALALGVAQASAKTLVYCSEGSPENFYPAINTTGTSFDASSRQIYNRLLEFKRGSTEVEGWLRGRPELRPLVDDDADGHTYLNAAGNLLFRVAREELALGPRAVWPPAANQSPAEKNGLSGVEHHRPRGWEKFVDRLAAIDCVERIVYDAAAHGGPRARWRGSTSCARRPSTASAC